MKLDSAGGRGADGSWRAPGARHTVPLFQLVVTASQLGFLSEHYCHNIRWKQYCSLPLKTFLYKIERDGFTTQGITQLKKQLTV